MNEFRKIIINGLSPLIGKRCVMPDLPYYSNVGDLLIWEGMERFLADNGTECLWRSSVSTFDYRELPKDVTICLVGGGNFGDLWRGLQEFRNQIVRLYPNNRIVVFPQSVYYNDKNLCKKDAEVFAANKDVHICVRDKKSFDFLKVNFPTCDVVLVPDMALYLEFEQSQAKTGRTLFLKRNDKESVDYSAINTDGMVISDWPMHQSDNNIIWYFSDKIRHKLFRNAIGKGNKSRAIRQLDRKFAKTISPKDKNISERWQKAENELAYLSYLNKTKYPKQINDIVDWFVQKYYKPLTIEFGVAFINQYDVVYATRLHAAVLGYLLCKEVHLIDNSYGKISAFFSTWQVKL